ncbi:hypothetical protein [Mucilaginibacter boryungensis]|uniref:Lipoprotein n=1 Tax=Mucilaginibacter boryungensis TaxID=768480 RepID=A0ABR9XJY4_9SPHI|nr:hypothetical protein [Mucilaginibacter boryungensis]MBE9667697.1 hypothetical protein [Mucilaginibacter boryungensis]
MNIHTLLSVSLLVYCTIISGCTGPQAQNKIIKHAIVKANNISSSTDHSLWVGNWERREFQEGAGIEIKSIEGDSLVFSADAQSGGHTGQIEGKAFINGNTAIYVDKDIKGASFIMKLQGDSVIQAEEKFGEGIGFGGIGVGFGGRFVNLKYLPKEGKKETLVSIKILNEQQDAIFRKLVDTSYDHFVESTQLTEDRTRDKDLDPDLHATVFASGVRGLYTFMENIIMIDKENTIWAAVLNGEKVYYFTNNKAYAEKLPNTIEEWRSRFKDYPVVYMSK